ncbi:MAG TPA: dTDP-4-dehydrorhamnose 3,5-epimerase [Paludibacter sp.]|nr:dTDP-4-dehydrorhamnose 3,5-epimerase [Paludibacter sp.]HPM08899.1 dTDP-4-dehydrorhamnose 3,5-epimerase [Paludibacter sp.]
MNPTQSTIPNVIQINPHVFGDSRGGFFESYNLQKFRQAGIECSFVQDNHSRSVFGTLRGLHYQIEHAQGKLVRVVIGEIFDVAIDLRKSSRFFGKWVSFTLSAENKKQLFIPPGFAHGLLTLSDSAEVLYKTSDFYSPHDVRSLLWNDPTLAIDWPLTSGQTPILSEKDLHGKTFVNAEVYK